MKKMIIIPLLIAGIMSSLLIFTSKPIHAADVAYTIAPLTDTSLKAILNDLNTRFVGWFTDYRYFIVSNSGNTIRYVYLVPTSSTGKLVRWDATKDSDNDLDGIYFIATCTVSVPCYRYQYTTAGAYSSVTTTTTSFTDSVSWNANPLHYTNLPQFHRVWYLAGSTWVVTDSNMDALNGGIPSISSNITDQVGLTTSEVTGGDRLIIEELKYTGNVFQDGFIFIGNVFIGLINGLIDVVSDLFEWLVDVMFTPSNPNAWANFTTLGNSYMNRIPCWSESSTFINNLTATGTKFAPVTTTLFGKTISFDIKANVFDQFLPVANNVKTVFKFVLWFGFVTYLWRVGQTLINGGNPPGR